MFLFNLLGAPKQSKMLLGPPGIIEFKIHQKYVWQFSKNAELFDFKEKNEGTKIKLQKK